MKKVGKNNCHKKWRYQNDRFAKYPLRIDENGQKFIPFCTYSGHIGLIIEDRYRFRKCENHGNSKPCSYYRRFRQEDQERLLYEETQSIEVTINQGNG